MSAQSLTTCLISFTVACFFCYQIYVFFKEEKRRVQPIPPPTKFIKHLESMQNDYKWITNIIQSCTNNFHFQVADKLIELFEARYSNIDYTATTELKQIRENKFNALNS